MYDAFGLKQAAALNGPQFLDATVLKTPVAVENAVAQVPDGPGLGLEVDEEKLRELSEKTLRDWNLLDILQKTYE